jgi:PAS domain S-box-containing protein
MLTHRTVLVIADSDESDNNYGHQLQQDGSVAYRIFTQPYDTRILALSQWQQIDGILLELHSPHSGSFEVLRQLKEQMGEYCPPIVVIDSDDVQMAVGAFKNGAADYLVKDRMTPDALRLAMQSAIENAELRREIQHTREQFQTSVENMLDCFGIFSAMRDESGQIVDFRIDYLNRAACENNRMPKKMQIGRGLCEILPAHRESGLFDEYCRLVETGEPLIKDSLIYDDTYGGEQRLIRAFDIRATKLNDGFVASWRDITDRKRLELELSQTTTELRQQQNCLQRLIDTAPIGIGIGSANGQVRVINDTMLHLHGLSSEEFEQQGMNWREFIPPEWAQKTEQSMAQLQQQGFLPPEEKELLRRDGSRMPIWISLTQWRDDTDEHVAFAVDLTEQKQTEATLKASQQYYQNLAEAMPQIVWTADATGAVNYWNQRWYDYTGLSEVESMGLAGVSTVHPDERADTLAKWSESITNGELFEIEYRIRRWDSEYHWFISRAIPTRDSDNQITGWIGTITDINNHKQLEARLLNEIAQRQHIEQELRREEEQLTLAMQAAKMGSWDWDIQTGKVNGSANLEHLFGMDVGSFDGRYETVKAMIHPDDFPWVEQAIHDAVYQHKEYNIEFRFIKPDGTVRWAVGLGRVFYDATGNPVQMTGIDMDISDRKQTEEALRQSKERYRCLAELIPQLVWTANAEGALLDVNQRWSNFTGLTLEQARTTAWAEVVHPDDVPVMVQKWTEAVQQQTSYQAEGRMRRADGVYRWHLHQAIPQKNEQGQIVKWFGTATDIDSQKQLEIERAGLLQREQAAREAAERANRIKDEFLAVLSHELRSPLNPILGWAKLLQTRKLDETKTAQALATIERNAKLQTQLIDDLLDVAKILRGKLSLNMTSVNLSFVIEAAIETVWTAARAKSISLHPVLLDIGQVSGDTARLQQVVWNLLSNAIKFTPNHGQVEIRLERVGNQAEMTVKDTGKGISPNFLPYIFESFRQEDASTTRQYGGLGLGLAIVRQLVEAHGGTITADSPGEGLGATFTVRLPLLNVEPEVKQTEDLPQPNLDLTGIRVLAVDDDPDARELLSVLLTQYGAEVLTVTNATEVLANLESFQPDVLVSDIGMPSADGYALIEQIRALPPEQGGQIPAIALTAYAREADHQRTLTTGYQRHITKPLELQQLVQAVAALGFDEAN